MFCCFDVSCFSSTYGSLKHMIPGYGWALNDEKRKVSCRFAVHFHYHCWRAVSQCDRGGCTTRGGGLGTHQRTASISRQYTTHRQTTFNDIEGNSNYPKYKHFRFYSILLWLSFTIMIMIIFTTFASIGTVCVGSVRWFLRWQPPLTSISISRDNVRKRFWIEMAIVRDFCSLHLLQFHSVQAMSLFDGCRLIGG